MTEEDDEGGSDEAEDVTGLMDPPSSGAGSGDFLSDMTEAQMIIGFNA